jgi:3-oxoacyl-[acyl-carrier protein] reductase
VLWRAAVVQALGVAVLSVALGLALPHDFFEDWGWIAGPAAWAACAVVTARVVGLPAAPTLVGAALAGVPSLVPVVLGVHWLGAVLAIGLFAMWCAAGARPRPDGARSLGSAGMDLGLNGKVALVTGASKGIGRAIAAELVAEGARVAVSSRSRERIDEAAASVGAIAFVHDAAELDDSARLLADVVGELGPIDVLVCNTGGPPGGADALGFTREQWQEAYASLVLGPMALIEAVMPGMRERRFGRILNVVSAGAREPIPNLMLSNAHRISMINAFKTLARQVAADGVTLNSVLPGRIDTDRMIELTGSREAAEAFARDHVPAARMGTVEEFAAVAAFLCSARASYVTGETVVVDGGLTQSVF